MMNGVQFLSLQTAFILIRTGLPISMQDLPNHDIIIDITKGYALRRIGAYAPRFVEEIVHTFIPLTSFCVASPQTDVCIYASIPTKTRIVSLTTTMTAHHTLQPQFTFSRERVSRLLDKDVSRVLSQNHPDEIISNTKSIVHFVNNEFHYQTSTADVAMIQSSNDSIADASVVPSFRPTSIELVLKQISSNRIGFDYLSDADLKLFLTAALSTIDDTYDVFDVKEALTTFSQLIVGQSIYALRYCSLDHSNTLLPQPCLCISTLFLRVPIDSTSTFSIYRLIPFPVVHDSNIYTYLNLPKFIGINVVYRTFLIWKEEIDLKECSFARVVQCPIMPTPVSLSRSSCLSQLFDENESNMSSCRVTQSENSYSDVMHIDDGIWLLNSGEQTQHCKLYSNFNDSAESISITEPTVFVAPCDRKLVCLDTQISSSQCSRLRLTTTPRLSPRAPQGNRFLLPTSEMRRTIVASHKFQTERVIQNLASAVALKQPRLLRLVQDFLSYILSLVAFIIILIISLIKFIRTRLHRELTSLQSLVQDLLEA